MARRNARWYLIGLTASLLGNSAMSLVAGIWVKRLTFSEIYLGSAGPALGIAVWLGRR